MLLFFTEMQEICLVDGMDQWPKVMNLNDSVECHFYLDLFLASGKEHFPEEFEQIEKMFFSLFVSQEDHEAIQEAMANVPMMGLFLYKKPRMILHLADNQRDRRRGKTW